MALPPRALYLITALSLLTAAPPLFAQTPALGEQLKAAGRAAEPSVVRLRVIGGRQQIDGDSVNSLVTTGVVISESGEILTSEFALQGSPDAVFVELANGSRTGARIVATDHVRRLVLLRVDSGGPWTPVQPAAKASVRVGQYSIALGRFYSPTSVNLSVGIVSALNRIHGRALQTDAKISPVNYGGPLVSLSGEALGILVPLSPRGRGTAGSGLEWYDSGIGFAIPMDDALESAGKLRAGADLHPGLLGLRLEDTGAFSSRVLVADVLPGGPAATAGLQRGDRILKMGERVMERPGMVEEYLLARYAGDAVAVLVERGGEQTTVTAQLAAELPVPSPGHLGLLPIPLPQGAAGDGARDLLQRMLRDLPNGDAPGGPAAAGAATAEKTAQPLRVLVIPGSPAAIAGLPSTIELLAVNAETVDSENQLRLRLRNAAADSIVKLTWRNPGIAKIEETEMRVARRIDRVERPDDALLSLFGTTVAELAAAQPNKAPAAAPGDGAAGNRPRPAAADAKGGAGAVGVRRREIEVPGKGRVVLLQAGAAPAFPVAPVVLLSAQGQSEERLLEAWRAAIERYGLVLLIPVNPENAAITDADGPLVMAGLQATAGELECDLRRAVVVAGKAQSALAFQLVADPASPLRGTAISEGWIDDSLIETAGIMGRSVLFNAPDAAIQPQEAALRSLSITQLRKAGFWVPEITAEQTFADTTGAWTLWLRSL